MATAKKYKPLGGRGEVDKLRASVATVSSKMPHAMHCSAHVNERAATINVTVRAMSGSASEWLRDMSAELRTLASRLEQERLT